jgi:hypothetical protein
MLAMEARLRCTYHVLRLHDSLKSPKLPSQPFSLIEHAAMQVGPMYLGALDEILELGLFFNI